MNRRVTDIFLLRRGRLMAYLHRSFPHSSRQDVEDAAAEAYADACMDPKRFERALENGGTRRVYGLFQCVAWRKLRGMGRKAARAFEQSFADVDSLSWTAPDQEVLACFADLMESAMSAAIQAHGGPRQAELRQALYHKFTTGDSDVAVARQFGFNRETVNRAKRQIRRHVFGPT